MCLLCFLPLTHLNLSCAEYTAFIRFFKNQITQIYGHLSIKKKKGHFADTLFTKEKQGYRDSLMNLTEGDKVYELHYLLTFLDVI